MPTNCFTYPCYLDNGAFYDEYGIYHPNDRVKYPIMFNDLPTIQNTNTPCNPLYDRNCMDNSLDVLNNIRPLTNTTYPPVNNVVAPNANPLGWLFNTTQPVNNTGQQAVSGGGIIDTIKANPIISLGVAAAVLYFFMGSGGGTYEQITTKRKGFGS